MSDLIRSNSSFFQKVDERDILSELLADKRSLNTRRAYERDLKDFFQSVALSVAPSPALIREFLQLERGEALSLVLGYKAKLIQRGLAEATVSRRLAAIKSLVKFAQKVGKCSWSLEEISGEKLQSYRDTTGVNKDDFKKILAVPDRTTRKGRRDFALLNLLWSNVLRRGEICKTNASDFDSESKTLAILGKGKGTQRESVTMSGATVEAIQEWLDIRGNHSPSDPLFIALDTGHYGHRLTGEAVYQIVRKTAATSGIKKRMSPHRCRHSGITAALDATNGDVRKVQKLSRHSKLDTLMIYDDNRQNQQGEISDLLSGLI